MARAIETIELTEVLHYEETIGGVTTTVAYWPLRKDADGVLLLRVPALAGRRINPANVANYIDSEMDAWLENDDTGYTSYFDEKMRACIIPTTIKVKPYDSDAVTEIARRAFLLSESEVSAAGGVEGDGLLSVLKAHTGAATDNAARIAYNSAGSAVYWWLRSAGSAEQMRFVYTDGLVVSGVASNTGYCPRPAFKVRNGTMVSDATEDTIYILPDETHLYRELQYAVVCGTMAARPKRAKVEVEITNATESKIYVSNNAGDAEPVWVECTAGAAVELTNEIKTTDEWQLGVKIYAKSEGRATCGEPAVIVEVDA